MPMGLYLNKRKHPTVFQSQKRIPEQNQVVYRIDFLERLLTEQKKTYETISESIETMNKAFQQHGIIQSNQLKQLNSDIRSVKNNQLQQANSNQDIKIALQSIMDEQTVSRQDVVGGMNNLVKRQDETNEKVASFFEKIESEQTYLRDTIQAYFTKIIDQQTEQLKALEHDGVKQEEIQRKMADITELGNVFKEQLQIIEKTQQQLVELIQAVQENQQTMTTKMDEQGDFQSGIIDRLETQEAYTDKIIRQLDHLRSIIFERAGVLAEKIEKGVKLTTFHITRFFYGTQKQTLQEFTQDVVEAEKEHQEEVKQ